MRSIHLFFVIVTLSLLITSCSSNHYGSRSAKYARSDKRVKSTNSHKEKRYVFNNASTTEKSEIATKPNILLRDEVVMKALQYTGRDYRPGGKSPETGFDCSGFTSFVFRHHGIQLGTSSDLQAKQGIQKSRSELEPGDLVFFGSGEKISHVGIVASHKPQELEIIHSTTSAGVKIDNISKSDYWQSRFLFGTDVISGRKDFQ
jgi:cell wall-associated NlpC family hydrolase